MTPKSQSIEMITIAVSANRPRQLTAMHPPASAPSLAELSELSAPKIAPMITAPMIIQIHIALEVFVYFLCVSVCLLVQHYDLIIKLCLAGGAYIKITLPARKH